ncbi:MAG: hypothetical protein HGA53_10210 [Anaerolineaceae bacterium]|nr:hypothetical protein [Anaerolineaceae bacterium]
MAEILTQGISNAPRPLADADFYAGYRERLESKLRHKSTQIARTERLLDTLPDEQKPAFRSLLNQAIHDRDEIQNELEQLFKLLNQFKDSQPE